MIKSATQEIGRLFFFQAEDGIRDRNVTGVQTCALPIYPLFARKPMSMLLAEAKEAGEHSLKRTLGPVQLTALGVGAVIGAGIFVFSGLGAHYAGPGLMLS